MQNRYVGDIGDFVKLAILRALSPNHHLGVLWWLYPDENHNGNGRHIGYLKQPEKWRALDPELYDGLDKIVTADQRNIRSLEDAEFLPRAKFFGEAVPIAGAPSIRKTGRIAWFNRARQELQDCDMVFVDPDNGLETKGFSTGTVVAGKSVSLAELTGLRAPGRTLIVYHHQTRRKGGHTQELAHWADRLRDEGFHSVDTIRSHPFSPRAFFILDAPAHIKASAEKLVNLWKGHLSWHPHLTRSDEAEAKSV